jgi:hypothetical protein
LKPVCSQKKVFDLRKGYPGSSIGEFSGFYFQPGGFVMKCNVGKTDRIVRVIIGLAIIWAGFYYEEWWGVIGIVPLATAAIGYCPAYTPFKFSTCRKDD